MSVAPEVEQSCDVVIIGLGPVGSTLGNILGGYGISTIIVERQPTAYGLPRAVAFDDEVMRVFQSLGLSEEMKQITTVGEGMEFVDANDQVLISWPRPKVPGSNGWYVNYRFHQPALETVLRNGIVRYQCVDILTGTEVVDLEQDEAGVRVSCRSATAEEAFDIRTKFVVGCDGANSFTRAAMGSGYDDLGFNEPWVVVDLLVPDEPADLAAVSVHYCNPERSATRVFLGGGRRRWEFRLRPDDDQRRITEPDNIWRLLRKWIGPEAASLERAAVYTFRSCVATRWREDRLMIAGDAAHLTPPFMGQGMCAGIRDAHNLGWKLHHVLTGRSSEDLLDTYQSEREAHVRAFIELTVQMGQVINSTASALSSGNVSDEIDGRQKISQLRPKLGPGFGSGPSEWIGRLFPQPHLTSGELLDDRVGNRFALIVNAALGPEVASYETALAPEYDMAVVRDPCETLASWFEASGLDIVLLRPDRYIAEVRACRNRA